MEELQDIVIEENKKRIKYMLLLDLIMLAASAAVLWVGFHDKSIMFKLVGAAGIIYFLAGLFAIAARIVKEKPLLIIKEEGVVDSSSASSTGFISYLDIDHVEMIDIMGQKAIGLVMCDNEKFMETLPAVKKNNIKNNLKLNYPAVILRVNTAKDMEIKDIYTLLKKRVEDFRALYR